MTAPLPALDQIGLDRYRELYPDAYFDTRHQNDPKRVRSIQQEKAFINRHVQSGRVCDIGCSTGEFLETMAWPGERYGMEISALARSVAEGRGIRFDRSILNEKNFFDLVIFRGTIQHVPFPFLYLHLAYEALRPGGCVVFLATPNANSIYYKLFNTLPMLDAPTNFYIPSDVTLSNSLRNIGFRVVEVEYPYLESPYSAPVSDHLKFIAKCLFRTKVEFAFWKNSMNLIARKDAA